MVNSIVKVTAKSLAPQGSAIRDLIAKAPSLPVNVSTTERWMSLAVGASLLANGILGRRLNFLSLIGGGALLWRGYSGSCQMYQALGINTATQGPEAVIPAGSGVRVESAITIDRPVHDIYSAWHDFRRLPQFMRHVREVQPINDRRSHWVAQGPLGTSVEWDADIIADVSDEVISWKSIEGSDIDTAGSVHFRPARSGHGTEVTVNFKYDPPAGKVGAAINKMLGNDPAEQLRQDLQTFKQIMEGDRPASNASISQNRN